MQEVGGAVERIDDPGVGLVGALVAAAFLAEEAVAGPRLAQLGAQHLLGAAVGGGDEIGRPLERDLQVLDLAEVALERARGLARGRDHHVEEGGVHVASTPPAARRRLRRSTTTIFSPVAMNGGTMHAQAVFELRRLVGRGGGLALDVGVGLDHFEHHRLRQLDADRPVAVQLRPAPSCRPAGRSRARRRSPRRARSGRSSSVSMNTSWSPCR